MANQLFTGPHLGFMPAVPTVSPGTQALNTAGAAGGWGTGFSATGLALSFALRKALTLTKLRSYVSAVTGTLGANDLVCDIYSDTGSGLPNTSLATSNTVTATPTGAAWVEYTGYNLALSADTLYWAVFRNANAAPATNSPTCSFGATGAMPLVNAAGSNKFGFVKATTTNSGQTWTQAGTSGAFNLRLTDGTSYAGYPLQSLAASATRAFGSNEIGCQWVLPGSASLTYNVAGAVVAVTIAGTPTGNVSFNMRTGSTPGGLVSTNAIAKNEVSAGNYLPLNFASTQALTGGTIVTLTVADSAADSSANAYGLEEYTFDSDGNSLVLLPFQSGSSPANMQRAAYNGTTWTYTTNIIAPMALVLDPVTPFTVSGSSTVVSRIIGGF